MDFIKEITCIQAVGTSDDEARKYGYESWIDYCHKVNIFTRFITKCPCCKKSFTNNNPAVGGHVLAERGTLDIEGKLIYVKYITPICKQCNDRYKTIKFGNSLKFMVTIYAACLTTLQNDKF